MLKPIALMVAATPQQAMDKAWERGVIADSRFPAPKNEKAQTNLSFCNYFFLVFIFLTCSLMNGYLSCISLLSEGSSSRAFSNFEIPSASFFKWK